MKKLLISAALLAALATAPGLAGQGPSSPPASSANGVTKAAAAKDEDELRLEGEQRYRTNCGRCHQAPHKYPPRMMATFVRHMRVRALITDEDMRLILKYMTQ